MSSVGRVSERGGCFVRHKGEYWAAVKDDRLAAASASILGLQTVEDRYSDDWYANNPDWADDLPDLSGEHSEEDDE